MNSKKKILIVGQTPPPYHGQAIMIQNTVDHTYKNLKIYHVKMNFSESVGEVGKFNFKKIGALLIIVLKIMYIRIRHGVTNLYYPPAGPNVAPILRDLVILGLTRFWFKVTIYHFRAGGISEKIETFPNVFKRLTRAVFNKPDLTIRLSANNPQDGNYFNTKKDVIIPNGLKDFYSEYSPKHSLNKVPILLYVGVIKESKGVFDLIRACAILKKKKTIFKLNLLGQINSEDFKLQLEDFISQNNLMEEIVFLGPKVGNEKWREFSQASIFCFPSFYECETFGNVLVEAMQYSLPIVATKWRGIPDIVAHNESGFLIEINSPEELAQRIDELIKNKEKREAFGKRGRNIFLEKYREDIYFENFEKELSQVCH